MKEEEKTLKRIYGSVCPSLTVLRGTLILPLSKREPEVFVKISDVTFTDLKSILSLHSAFFFYIIALTK